MDDASQMTVDLTNCDREPIHLLGHVQSYGALVAVSSDWIVQHASANLGDILGVPVEDALGKQLQQIIVSDGFDLIRRNLRTVDVQDGVARLFNIALAANGRSFDVSVHRCGRHLIVEFEPKARSGGSDVMTEVYPHIRRIQNLDTLPELARQAAKGLRALCGFDSVMVYQFQPDDSGRVIAEERADGRKKYNGMMFPASDIPVQARELYRRSLLRLIADVRDEGAPILPPAKMDGRPLDLSLAVTRSVSPIHIEYLSNMGVQASMSVSIMKDGKLWGLFACHHDTPRYIDYERRTAVEMYGHLFSYELSRFEAASRTRAEEDTSRLQTLLMAQMADRRSVAEALLDAREDIARVIPHDGIILVTDGAFHAFGATPTEEEFRGIVRMLDGSIATGVFATDSLGRLLPEARDYAERCSGLLAIPISRRPRDYMILCRRQIAESIHWAGDPTKPAGLGPNGVRLTPRKSFDAWKEEAHGRAPTWSARETHAAELLKTVLLEVYLKVTEETSEDRRRAQEQQQLLISELNHRVRNILNLMRGLISQSKQSASTVQEFTQNLDARIHSLARAHDQLTREMWEPASLKDLIACEFEAYAVEKANRVEVRGDDVMLQPEAFTTLALVLHEMATNSVKYGALCDKRGTIRIDLSRDVSGGLLMDWVERNGPPVKAPKRRGFGSLITEKSIPHDLRGDARVEYRVTGLEAHYRVPPSFVQDAPRTDGPAAKAEVSISMKATDDFQLSGRGLVVEDSMIIALDAAGILESFGAQDVRVSSGVREALDEIESTSFDFALLDVNLGDELSVPVAEALAAKGVPFVLATGYGETDDLLKAYPPTIIVQKPFSDSSIRASFVALFGSNGN